MTSNGGDTGDVSVEDLAERVRAALSSADLDAFAALLDPEVHWGPPGGAQPTCRNRKQVVAQYRRGQEAGIRAQVADVTVVGDHLLVALTVGGSPDARDRGARALRWQVLAVRHGKVIDIVGFDDRADALAHAGAVST